eukprot:jgi/Botrbrau1/10337/Bobra.0321s0013.1
MRRRYCDSAYGDERPICSPGEYAGRSGTRRSERRWTDRSRDDLVAKYWDLQQWMCLKYMPSLQALDALCQRTLEKSANSEGAEGISKVQVFLTSNPKSLENTEECSSNLGHLFTDMHFVLQAMHIRQLQPLICRLRMDRNDPAQSISWEDYEWLKRMSQKLRPFLAEIEETALRDIV